MRLMPRSLRSRLVLLFAAGTLAALVLCLSLLFVALDRELRTSVDDDLSSRGDDLVAALRDGDLSAVTSDPYAQLYNADGTVMAGSASLAGQRLLQPAEVRAIRGMVSSSRTLPLGPEGHAADVRLRSRVVGSGDVLTVALPYGVVEQASSRQMLVIVAAVPLLAAVLAGLGWTLVRAALRPVDVLTREAAAISTLENGRRLPAVAGDDEIARLAATLDAMLARLAVAFAREREFVDDASHELRTPVAVLRGEIELALSEDDPAEVRRSLLAAQDQVDRLARLTEDLLLLARERDGSLAVHREPVDLADLAAAEARALGPAMGLAITVRGEPVVVEADPDRLRQVFANLAANSAAAGAATVAVRIGMERTAVRLEWADDGPGFPPDVLASAFERFVRGTSSRASGAGLGLSIVRAVMIAHGGSAGIRNEGGGVVTVRLPMN
ncbi:ATP-binding protein [Actinoplanes sp. CA-142083]|uniref:ATP-binding protein n=1 Tax=Actinoplanes sp. CA-142083 TaxID=3239903 RepID=UPI003D8CDF6E